MRYVQVKDDEVALVMDYAELEVLYSALVYLTENEDVDFYDDIRNQKFENVCLKVEELYEDIDRPP